MRMIRRKGVGMSTPGPSLNWEDLKKDFPLLKRRVNGKPLTYLDSAATSLTPVSVVEAMNEYYERFNANIHRGIHKLSEEATEMYEAARAETASFINAPPQEVVFTKNATESLNTVAKSLELGRDDNVVLTVMEHHSNLVPWLARAEKEGFQVRFIPLKGHSLDLEEARSLIDENTKAVSVVHVSNVLGVENPVRKIFSKAKAVGAVTVLDASQSAPHRELDAEDLLADVLAFSSHKALGPTGVGVLRIARKAQRLFKPLTHGGGAVKSASEKGFELLEFPHSFEAGTPNVAGVIGHAEALRYLKKLGLRNVESFNQGLAEAAEEILLRKGAAVYAEGCAKTMVAFNLPKVHPHDVSELLSEEGVAIRAGHHCALPLHKALGLNASCRASFHAYNDQEDLERFSHALEKVKKLL